MPVQNSKENRKKCLCPNCPSYPHECDGEVLYCAEKVGHSQCDVNAKGCLCPGCLVWSENNIKEIYYCTRDTIELASARGGSAFGGKVVMRKKKPDESNEFYQTVADIKTIAETGESIE